MKNIEKALKSRLKQGEQLKEFAYGLLKFKGHAIGLTDKRLLLLKIGTLFGKVKSEQEIALGNIAEAHYEGGSKTAIEALFVLKTNDGKEYKFKITRAAGLSGGKNFEHAQALHRALVK